MINNFYDQNWRGSGLGSPQKKFGIPLFISATVEASNFKFGIQVGLGCSLPRNNFYDQNWQGAELGEYPKKFGTPDYLCNRLTATSNLVYKLGLENSLPKKNFTTKIGRGTG